jgi:diguanylate cyclase (GGDEF)-like protein
MNGNEAEGGAMERFLMLFAVTVGLCIALSLPSIRFAVGFQSLQAILETEAEINARLATQIVNANPELWTVQEERLAALVERRPADRTPEVRQVLGARGEIVASQADPLAAPVVEAAADIFDSGQAVGRMRVARSLRPLLIETGWVAALALALGFGVYLALKLLPLRALAEANRKLRQLANYDSLTGLPNRALFRDRLGQAMVRARRSQRRMALMFIDLDRFKDVNDTMGHAFGDRLLRHVATAIEHSLRATDTVSHFDSDDVSVARLGGDEFTVILEGIVDAGSAAVVAERILRALEAPYADNGREVFISASIGITLYPHDEVDIEELIRHADTAMYKSKEKGRNAYTFYSGDLNAALDERMGVLADLHHALDKEQFVLHFQPKARLGDGRVTGVEALIRWRHPVRGLVPPDRFIPLLEETGLIVPVGDWVIRHACETLAAWDRQGLPGLSMAVNISARQLRSPDLLATLQRILGDTGIVPRRLELELTESMLVEDSEATGAVLSGIKSMGMPVAIDDFGTGQSSLSYLKRFNIDVLKIDRSFVRDIPGDLDDCAISEAVVALARALRLTVVAEGVETEAQAEFLRDIRCDSMQGYLLSRPLPAEEFVAWYEPRYGAVAA